MNSSEIILIIGLCSLGVLCLVILRAYNKWNDHRIMRQAKEQVERLHREEDAGFPPNPTDYNFAISFDKEKVTVTDIRGCDHKLESIEWSEVRRATVFKRDLFTTDCICLFLARDDDSGLELNEEMGRWRTVIAALPQLLPGCQPSETWFASVAFPAFQTNQMEIYLRGIRQQA